MIIQCIMHWFYILFKKNCDCFFLKGAFVPVPRQAWVLWPTKLWKHRLLTSTAIWVFIRDCSLALLPKKKPWGFLVFSHSFSQELVPKNKHEKKQGLYIFFGFQSLNSNLTPPKKNGWRLGKVCFFLGGSGVGGGHIIGLPFFGKALWRLRRHLCPDHHLSTGHHPPENAGVTPWVFTNMAGWKMDPLTMYFPIEKWPIFQPAMLVYQRVFSNSGKWRF